MSDNPKVDAMIAAAVALPTGNLIAELFMCLNANDHCLDNRYTRDVVQPLIEELNRRLPHGDT